MKKLSILTALAVPALAIFASCSDESTTLTPTRTNASARVEGTGNGAPTGAHYNLNIIGVPKGKSADMTGNNGGRIFVPLEGRTRISLTPAPTGESFKVLDANATDGAGSFQLPKDVSANWTVWARVPGNRGGSATITTCAEYAWDGTPIDIGLCSSVTLDRLNYGKFTNVSADLLFVTLSADVLDANGNVVVEAGTYPLFDDALMNYFWEYDNNGLKLLQLRFYAN